MTLAISVMQAGPIRGLAPASPNLPCPRPAGAARVTARAADMAEERAASGILLGNPRGSDRRNVPRAGQALSTRFQKYDNGTRSPSPTAPRSPVGEGELIRWRTFEAVNNLGKHVGQNGKNGGTNPSNSCIIINMIQKTNLEQT